MISKIIQKEKCRQDKWLEVGGCVSHEEQHKQSLISLKEYMEDVRINISKLNLSLLELGIRIKLFDMMRVLTEDIEELTKMIGRYE